MSDYWTRNLPPHIAALPLALGLGDKAPAPSARTLAIYEAARALIAVEMGVPFDVATSGARPGLQDANGGRIDEVEGEPGVRLALAGMVATRDAGELAGHYLQFFWAASQAEVVEPSDVDGALRRAIVDVRTILAKHSHVLSRLADRLEGGDKVPAADVLAAISQAKGEN